MLLRGHIAHRHLMGAPIAFGLLAVDRLRTGPAFRRAHDDHRPGRALREPLAARLMLDVANIVDHFLQRLGHQFVHDLRIVALDKMGFITVAAHQMIELVVRDARENGRIGDLVAVEMQDRQHRPIALRIEELVGVPAGGQRPSLRLAVADHGGDDQVRIVEGRAVGVRKRVAKLAALVDRAGRLGRDVAWDSAGKRELGEEPLHPVLVLRDVRIDLAVGSFEIGVGDQPRTAVAGAGDIDHVEIELLDQAVQVRVDEIEAGVVPQWPSSRGLMCSFSSGPQQRVVEQVDLADRQIVGGAPIGVDQHASLFDSVLSVFDNALAIKTSRTPALPDCARLMTLRQRRSRLATRDHLCCRARAGRVRRGE